MKSTQPDNKTTIERPDWLTEDVWPFAVRTAQLSQATVSYTDEGSGPTLLLVHDGMCSFLWGQLMERLVTHFRVVTLDFPGSGLSQMSSNSASLQGDSKLLAEFAAEIGLDHYTLVTHDLGGGVGMGTAVEFPDRVDGLVLINTFAWPPNRLPLRWMLRLMGSRVVSGLSSATNFIVRLSSTRFGVGRNMTRPARRAFVSMFDRPESRRRFHTLMASAAKETEFLRNIEDKLGVLTAKPTLTIFGKRNDPFRFQMQWQTHFPDADQMVIPGGYHFPMCDAPDEVAERITQWHNKSA